MTGTCCSEHGPDCKHNFHPVCSLEVYYSNQGLCGNCGVREGTVKWGESIQIARGHFTLRCELCVAEAQLEHAEERSHMLDELRLRVKELRGEDESNLLTECLIYLRGSDEAMDQDKLITWIEGRLDAN